MNTYFCKKISSQKMNKNQNNLNLNCLTFLKLLNEDTKEQQLLLSEILNLVTQKLRHLQ